MRERVYVSVSQMQQPKTKAVSDKEANGLGTYGSKRNAAANMNGAHDPHCLTHHLLHNALQLLAFGQIRRRQSWCHLLFTSACTALG